MVTKYGMEEKKYTVTIEFEKMSDLIEIHRSSELYSKKRRFERVLYELWKSGYCSSPQFNFISQNPPTAELELLGDRGKQEFLNALKETEWLTDKLKGFNYAFNELPVSKKYFLDNIQLPDVSNLTDKSFDQINHLGYRCPHDLDKINWSESILMLGCSSLVGPTLNYKDTVPAILENIIQKPVISLAVCGTSISFSWLISTILSSKNNIPKAVIIYYTFPIRTMYYDTNEILHLGPWSLEKDYDRSIKDYFLAYSEENNSIEWARMYRLNIRQIWKTTKLIEVTAFAEVAEHLGLPCLPVVDLGSDHIHHGPETALIRAEILADRLKAEFNV